MDQDTFCINLVAFVMLLLLSLFLATGLRFVLLSVYVITELLGDCELMLALTV